LEILRQEQHEHSAVLRKNLASAKIVKIEFSADLELLGFTHFYCAAWNADAV